MKSPPVSASVLVVLFFLSSSILTLNDHRALAFSSSPALFRHQSSPDKMIQMGILPTTTPSSTALSASTSSSNNFSPSSSSFSMEDLRRRMQQVSDNETTLPLVVLEAMLPRQVISLQVQNQGLVDLVKSRLQQETPTFGMLGLDPHQEEKNCSYLLSGVEVEIVGTPQVQHDSSRIALTLRAKRRFRIEEEESVESKPGQGWTQAKVEFLDSTKEDAQTTDARSIARAKQLCRQFHYHPNQQLSRTLSISAEDADSQKSLVELWVELAKQNERMPGQVDRLLEDLGPIPSWDEPSECALWIGALLNPLPPMGVAHEVRAKLLVATTAEERARIALDTILHSIQLMRGHRRRIEYKIDNNKTEE